MKLINPESIYALSLWKFLLIVVVVASLDKFASSVSNDWRMRLHRRQLSGFGHQASPVSALPRHFPASYVSSREAMKIANHFLEWYEYYRRWSKIRLWPLTKTKKTSRRHSFSFSLTTTSESSSLSWWWDCFEKQNSCTVDRTHAERCTAICSGSKACSRPRGKNLISSRRDRIIFKIGVLARSCHNKWRNLLCCANTRYY